MRRSGEARVGVDDLLHHITGNTEWTFFKYPDENVKKGECLAEMHLEDKNLKIYSPISGKILQTNPLTEENIENVSNDPYVKGWIYEIKPTKWIEETGSMLFAQDAKSWMTKELSRFKDFLNSALSKQGPEIQPVILQEGGEPVDHVLSSLPKEIWIDFQEEFLEKIS
jgi:glycine cleavage system H protein